MQSVSKNIELHKIIFIINRINIILLYLFLVANALWNNLLQPIGNKTTTLLPVFKTFLCPTFKRPYLVTRENSQI